MSNIFICFSTICEWPPQLEITLLEGYTIDLVVILGPYVHRRLMYCVECGPDAIKAAAAAAAAANNNNI